MSRWRHLARRFLGALRPDEPKVSDIAWTESVLSAGELALWRRMSPPDRRHSVHVARGVLRVLGDAATRPVLAAALLHDVGKIDAGLGTFGRVLATLTIGVRGREGVAAWHRARGIRRRFALYARHPQIGGDLLRLAGSDPLTSAWAYEHDRPRAAWSVPAAIGDALTACDND